MKITRLPGLSTWAEFQSDRNIDFSGFHWATPAGGLLIDPMPLDAGQLAKLQERGGARWIFVTSAEHMRAAPQLAQSTGAKVIAMTQERARFENAATSVDLWIESTSDLPAELAELVDVIPLHGGKSPVEAALYLKPLEAFYFGDVIRSHESGTLRLLPDPKVQDMAALEHSLAPLTDRAPQAVLLGDGDSLYTGAAEALAELLAKHS